MQALQPLMDGVKRAMMPSGDDVSDAAKEAVSEEMGMAMLKYLPLRGAVSFSGGAISMDTMNALLDALNNA